MFSTIDHCVGPKKLVKLTLKTTFFKFSTCHCIVFNKVGQFVFWKSINLNSDEQTLSFAPDVKKKKKRKSINLEQSYKEITSVKNIFEMAKDTL